MNDDDVPTPFNIDVAGDEDITMGAQAVENGEGQDKMENAVAKPSPVQTRCFRPHPRRSKSNSLEDTNFGRMKFCMGDFVKHVMKHMYLMKSNQMLTDVKLEVGREIFHAHKVVLAAASPYFKAMFTGGLRECEMNTVKLQGVCPTVMAYLLRFMYTGEVTINEMLVCQLLPAATMFQVSHVIEACCTFLEQQLDPCNAIGIASFVQQHGCMDLYRKANRFIEQHFTQVCQEEEFLQLSACQLVALIKRDELNVQEEREVYNAVLKWVKYDEDNRYPKMEHILQAVRCQYLTPTFLEEQMKNCDILKKVPACREYLAQIFKDLTLHKTPCIRERRPNAPCTIYTAGGYLRQSLDILECYNAEEKCWVEMARLPTPRSGLGGAFLKGLFYAVGGRNNSPGNNFSDCNWVDCYNPITNHWQACKPMSVARHRLGVQVMDGLLYAIGGSAGTTYLDSVERYDPEEDKWTTVAPMAVKRLGVGVCVVNRLMYAVGGYDGVQRLNSMECYHPEKDEWKFVTPMNSKRSGAGVISINNNIYVVGGFDGQQQLTTVELYDTEKDTWTYMSPMKSPRSALSVVALEGKMYALGGYDGQEFLPTVEVYDPETNEWIDAPSLTCGRSGHATAVCCHPCLLHCEQLQGKYST